MSSAEGDHFHGTESLGRVTRLYAVTQMVTQRNAMKARGANATPHGDECGKVLVVRGFIASRRT